MALNLLFTLTYIADDSFAGHLAGDVLDIYYDDSIQGTGRNTIYVEKNGVPFTDTSAQLGSAVFRQSTRRMGV